MAYLEFGKGGACGARAYNGGLGVEPPAGSRGRVPGQGNGGLKLKHIWLWTFDRYRKFAIFSKIWKLK